MEEAGLNLLPGPSATQVTTTITKKENIPDQPLQELYPSWDNQGFMKKMNYSDGGDSFLTSSRSTLTSLEPLSDSTNFLFFINTSTDIGSAGDTSINIQCVQNKAGTSVSNMMARTLYMPHRSAETKIRHKNTSSLANFIDPTQISEAREPKDPNLRKVNSPKSIKHLAYSES